MLSHTHKHPDTHTHTDIHSNTNTHSQKEIEKLKSPKSVLDLNNLSLNMSENRKVFRTEMQIQHGIFKGLYQ